MIETFPTAETAWFWTCAVLRARAAGRAGPPGPCRTEDVLRGLDRLYRNRRLELLHVRVLRRWGWRGHPLAHGRKTGSTGCCGPKRLGASRGCGRTPG